MKRIFTFLVSVFLFTMVMGQAPTALIKKTTVAPKIDGLVDAVWATATKNDIKVIMTVPTKPDETPTVGNSWWKGLWDEKGIYVLCFVEDDVYVPAYMGTKPGDSWMYDKLEIYFDCNFVKKDGLGGGSKMGHYQFAPTEKKDFDMGGKDSIDLKGFEFSFDATTKPHYYAEYFFPFTSLLDKDGIQVDKMEPIGFDVNIMDNDILTPLRNRMNWASNGANGENWSNMDDAGLITLDGAIPPIPIDKITISGGAITVDNGTFQLVPVIVPLDATVKTLNYSITGGTSKATISETGLLTGITNGTVTIRTQATDGGGAASNEVTITISNQVITIDKITMIKNGNFKLGTDGKQNWVGNGVVDSEGFYSVVCVPKVETVDIKAQIWDNIFGQGVTVADAATKYIVKFKAKASVDMAVPTFFEDRGNGNDKIETSLSSYRTDANWMIPVTTTEAWYTFDVTFSAFKSNSAYELNFQLGKNDGTFSINNVQMYSEADLALVPTSSKTIAANQLSVYPNPVVNELTVGMTASNVKVAIYNSLGQKMMEKVSTGNVAKFNVSSLVKGMYIVKLSDGTTQKFIK